MGLGTISAVVLARSSSVAFEGSTNENLFKILLSSLWSSGVWARGALRVLVRNHTTMLL